jgi:hypothetical protein
MLVCGSSLIATARAYAVAVDQPALDARAQSTHVYRSMGSLGKKHSVLPARMRFMVGV